MPHAKRSSASKMHGGRPRNSLRSNSLARLSAVCIQPALNRMAHVALGTCPTHACHLCCDANFFINRLLESMPFRVNHTQVELLNPQLRQTRHAPPTPDLLHRIQLESLAIPLLP